MMKVMEDAMMESRCLQASDGGNSAGKMLGNIGGLKNNQGGGGWRIGEDEKRWRPT